MESSGQELHFPLIHSGAMKIFLLPAVFCSFIYKKKEKKECCLQPVQVESLCDLDKALHCSILFAYVYISVTLVFM